MGVAFSVRRSRAERVGLALVAALFLVLGAGLTELAWFTDDAVDPADPWAVWLARVAGLFFLAAFVVVLRAVRFAIGLDDDRLVRQGAFLRRRIALRTATFQIKDLTLVVRTSRLSRIRLPLVQRTGNRVVDGRVVVAWLPPDELGALVDAMYRYATAANRERVAQFLRARGASVHTPLT